MIIRTGKFIALCIMCLMPITAFAEKSCIAVIPATLHTHYWKVVVQGAKDAGVALNVPVRVRATSLEKDTLAQRKIVSILKRRGCRGFVIAPVDTSLNEEVEGLLKDGIPTVYVDRGTDGQDQTKAIVATDNYAAGYRAGEEMVQYLGGSGKVGVMRLHETITTSNLREQGFIDAAQNGGLDIVLNEYLGISYGSAFRQATKLRRKLRKLDGVFTSNESVTQGVMLSLMQQEDQPFPLHIGFDLNEKIAEGIAQGRVKGVIIQDPYQMGYQGVHLALAAINGKALKKHVTTPIYFVTNENLVDHIQTIEKK